MLTCLDIRSLTCSVSLVAFHCHLRSFLLRVLNLASHVSIESEEGGTGEITLANILNLDFSSCQPLAITYCTAPLIQSLTGDVIRSLMFYLIVIYVRCRFKTWTYTNYVIILWKMISKLIRAQFGILFSSVTDALRSLKLLKLCVLILKWLLIKKNKTFKLEEFEKQGEGEIQVGWGRKYSTVFS